MKLQSINIKNFRSIEFGELVDCDSFNVLIGKNNSGKSNIFSAINAFFACIQKGPVATFPPIIGGSKEIDFFEKQTHLPIEIFLTFLLSIKERDSLLGDIITESQQMKNAVEGMDTDLYLNIRLIIPNQEYSYVSELNLVGKQSNEKRILLEISEAAAQELFLSYKSYSRVNKANFTLNEMIEYSENNIRRFPGSDRTTPMGVYRRFASELPSSLRMQLEQWISATDTLPELIGLIREYLSREENREEAFKEIFVNNKISTFSGDDSKIPEYVKNILKKVASTKVLYLKEQRKSIGKEEAEELLSLKVEKGGDDIFKDFQSIVASLLGVKIDAYRNRGTVDAKLDIDNFLVEVNGSGIREALRVVLDVKFKEPDILLVEEPEIHLHPALETSMMHYLKAISSTCQVFITTHSTNFLDTSEMKHIYLVTKSRSTNIQAVHSEDAIALIAQELGLRLSSLFMYDNLIFVEGPSDEDILNVWASLFKVNFSQHAVGFVHMESGRNYSYYATDKILTFLKDRQVRLWFFIDRDEKNDADIEKLKNISDGKATVIVLKKREIENYLVHPRVLANFLNERRYMNSNGKAGDAITETEIEKLIHQSAESLKDYTIAKRVLQRLRRSIHPSFELKPDSCEKEVVKQIVLAENNKLASLLLTMDEDVEKLYEEEKKLVYDIWERQKLDLVAGEELLNMIFRKFGFRYKKTRDAILLANLMNPDEVDPDLKNAILQIGRG